MRKQDSGIETPLDGEDRGQAVRDRRKTPDDIYPKNDYVKLDVRDLIPFQNGAEKT